MVLEHLFYNTLTTTMVLSHHVLFLHTDILGLDSVDSRKDPA